MRSDAITLVGPLLLAACAPAPPPAASLTADFTCAEGTAIFAASTDGPVVEVRVTLPSADWSTPLAEVHTGEWEVSVPLEGLAETCGDAAQLDWVVVATTDDARVLEQTPSGVYDPDATP